MQQSSRIIMDFLQFFTDGRPTQCSTTDDPLIIHAVEEGHRERQAHYRPAKEMRHPAFCRNHKKLLRILDKNPTIRTQHPRPNELLVHAEDFRQYIKEQAKRRPSELLDCESVAEATLVAQARKADQKRLLRQAKERTKKIANQG
jgi:hypothetical protein